MRNGISRHVTNLDHLEYLIFSTLTSEKFELGIKHKT